MTSKALKEAINSLPKKVNLSQTERATKYVEGASRVRLQDLKDNPGAKVMGRLVRAHWHNQAGHTIGELERAAKPPIGWIWGDFFRPWQRMFPGERHFNGDINLRREYTPVSLLELQRLIDLGWLDTSRLIDITQLCNTYLIKVQPQWRQFGIHLTDEGAETLTTPINLEVQWASQTTIAAVERAGGRIRLAYYDRESLAAAVDPKKFFEKGLPIPRRKQPPHSLMSFYLNPKNRGSSQRLLVMSSRRKFHLTRKEQKHPDQIFLGLEPGSIVNVVDKKVYRPTHPVHQAFYKTSEPLADYLR
ncbi:39S ribosomal protein L15, mitochondrial [Aphelenchoides bicaudatus]|nr:39S ribosomal protein L15, mitochondrial [Aphelenchoides bicaudatus]